MQIDYMSSEESDEEADETDVVCRTFILRPLVWRSQEANAVMESLDRKANCRRTPRALEMIVKRKTGMPSSRNKPIECPIWAAVSES